MNQSVLDWATKSGVPLLLPEQFSTLGDSTNFQTNICMDYGKFIRRTPLFLLRPASLDQLVASVVFLRQELIPYKVRGAAHSSGGQVLTESGAVIDLSGMTRILEDQPDQDEVLLEGGIWWLTLAEYLHSQGRRPLVITDNLRTTVAGTLSVGGFGDLTHLFGLQIASVTGLTLVTPNGNVHRVGPGDSLFRFALAGRGQLGIIAEAGIKTLHRTSHLSLRLLKWHSLSDYVEDAIRLIESRYYEFSRIRVRFLPESPHGNSVVGVAGNFQDELPHQDDAAKILQRAKLYPYEHLDLHQHYTHDPSGRWNHCSPSVEMIFPLPDGLKHWEQFNKQIFESGLYRFLPRGSSIMILKSDPRFPLAPLPTSDYCMMIALRPAMTLPEVNEYLPLLHSFEDQALSAGAKLYLMSIEPQVPNFLELEFGEAHHEFIRLKNELDPNRLLNPGLIP
jgi:cytokinin dehydrogenase